MDSLFPQLIEPDVAFRKQVFRRFYRTVADRSSARSASPARLPFPAARSSRVPVSSVAARGDSRRYPG